MLSADIACADFKDIPKTTTSDELWCDKAFNVAKNPKWNEYQRRLALTVCKFFHKMLRNVHKTSGGAIKGKIVTNQKLGEELHKLILKKCEKTKSTFFF